MGRSGGVHGSLGAHEREGKSVRTHAGTFEQGAGTRTCQAPWRNRKARTMQMRMVRPCGRIGRVRVVLG
jgi:hypothetical protein